MLRAVIGVVVGYAVMMIIIGAVFIIGPVALGLDTVFQPGTYWTQPWWNWGTLALGFFAAILGGWLCRMIARGPRAGIVLAVLILGFGTVSAVMNMRKPDPPAREMAFKDMPTEEAMTKLGEHAKEPNWYAFAKFAVGAAGVALGNRRRSRGPAASHPGTSPT